MKIYELKHIRHYNESVNLYTAKNVLRGVHRDGERYTLVVTEPNLDEGTGPEAVTVLNTIDWDNVFYIYWERPNGPVEYYVITVTDSSDNEVAIIEVDANTTNYTIDGRSEEGNPSNITLTNGETYTIVVEVVLFNSSIGSTEFTATPVDVTVSTPTLGAVTANTAEISWAVPNGDVGSYTIQVTNEDISTVEQTITGIEGTSAEIYGLTKDVNYSIRVKAVSEQNLFESDWSVSVEFIVTDKPDAPTNLYVDIITEGEAPFLYWDEVGGVSGYDIYYREQGEEEFLKLNTELVTEMPRQLVELDTGDYDLYMVSVTEGLVSELSEIISFNVFMGLILGITENDFTLIQKLSEGKEVLEINESDFSLLGIVSDNFEIEEINENDYTLVPEDS